jgi:hypothetical protein
VVQTAERAAHGTQIGHILHQTVIPSTSGHNNGAVPLSAPRGGGRLNPSVRVHDGVDDRLALGRGGHQAEVDALGEAVELRGGNQLILA